MFLLGHFSVTHVKEYILSQVFLKKGCKIMYIWLEMCNT
jgi:hypothetical protein